MKNLKETVLELLTSNVLIDFEKKKFITENIENFQKDALLEIIELLGKAKKVQSDFLVKALQANPELIKKMHLFAKNLFNKSRKEKESALVAEDEEILEELDKELNNLI